MDPASAAALTYGAYQMYSDYKKSRARKPARKASLRRSRIPKGIKGSFDVHRYRHTAPPISIVFNTGNTGATGFVMPGTTSSSTNPGLQLLFFQNQVICQNANSGSANSTFQNAANYATLI